MRTKNLTPFRIFTFESLHPLSGHAVHVFVIKGTFLLVNRSKLALLPIQNPIIMKDSYYGDPLTASLREENDLAVYKPQTDIFFVDPIAYAPSGAALPAWRVSFDIGNLHSQYLITGSRFWRSGAMGSLYLSPPEPTDKVAFRFEKAFGGNCRQGEKTEVYEANPVGLGFNIHTVTHASLPCPAHQIEFDSTTIEHPRNGYAAGITPVARAWQPRRGLAGTFDDEWRQQRWPLMPKDFNFRFYNAAPTAMTYDTFLCGNERVSICNLFPFGDASFSLPGDVHPTVLLLSTSGPGSVRLDPILDTLAFKTDILQVELTWRASIPKSTEFDDALFLVH